MAIVPPAMAHRLKEHARAYLATDGDEGHMMVPPTLPPRDLPPQPSLLLVTKGRRSGRYYLVPLFYRSEDDGWIVVASRGGSLVHPAWYSNLEAEPRARVQIKGDRFDVRARTAHGEERARLWRMMAERMPFYDEYQAKTDREIPVVVLSRDR